MNKPVLRVWLIFLGMISFFITAYDAFASKPHTLSLRDAILLSFRYSPNIESSELQRVLDKFNVALAKNQFEFQYALLGSALSNQSVANGAPVVTNKNFNLTPAISRQTQFGTQYNLAMSNPLTYNSANAPGYFYNPALTLQVIHPLLKGSGSTITEANLNIALINDEIAKLNLKNTVINQVTQVILDYRAVVAAENTLIVDQSALTAARKTVFNNKKIIALGFLAPSENIQAETVVASQEIQVASDINAITQARLLLFRDIGIPSDNQLAVDKTISTANPSYPKGAIASQLMYQNNISYLSALLGLKIGKLRLLLAEDQQRWSLNVLGTIMQGSGSGGGGNAGIDSLFNGLNNSRTLGLELAVPIDNMSAQQQVVQAKVVYSQQKLAAKQLKLNLSLQLESALQNLAIVFSQINLAKKFEALANKSYLDALKKSTFGQASMFEVTTLQNSLVSAQIQTIRRQIDYLNSVTQYEKDLGITLDTWNIKLVY